MGSNPSSTVSDACVPTSVSISQRAEPVTWFSANNCTNEQLTMKQFRAFEFHGYSVRPNVVRRRVDTVLWSAAAAICLNAIAFEAR